MRGRAKSRNRRQLPAGRRRPRGGGSGRRRCRGRLLRAGQGAVLRHRLLLRLWRCLRRRAAGGGAGGLQFRRRRGWAPSAAPAAVRCSGQRLPWRRRCAPGRSGLVAVQRERHGEFGGATASAQGVRQVWPVEVRASAPAGSDSNCIVVVGGPKPGTEKLGMLGMPEHPARLKPQAAMATVRFMVASVHLLRPRPRCPSRAKAHGSRIEFRANVP